MHICLSRSYCTCRVLVYLFDWHPDRMSSSPVRAVAILAGLLCLFLQRARLAVTLKRPVGGA